MKKVVLAAVAAIGLGGLTAPAMAGDMKGAIGAPRTPAYSWSRKKRSKDGGTNPNRLGWRERQKLLGSTHYLSGGKMRSRKKLTNHLPRGVSSAIGVNGIRGAAGAGR